MKGGLMQAQQVGRARPLPLLPGRSPSKVPQVHSVVGKRPLRHVVVLCDPDDERAARGSSSDDTNPAAPGPGGASAQRPPQPDPDSAPSSSSSSSSSSDGGAGGGSAIPDTLPLLGSDTDWRVFRAKLVSASKGSQEAGPKWAHPISRPEPGAVLLAHPALFLNRQTYFYKAAILLLEHSEEGGSYGVILNRPSRFLLKDLSLTRSLPEFDDCRLYMGGDVGRGEIMVLHPHGQLEGAQEVVRGIHIGGVAAARVAIERGAVQADDFRWFTNYAGWGPGQLAQECKRGVWFSAAASPELVLQGVEAEQGPEYWHVVMTTMGGDYAELSEVARRQESGGPSPAPGGDELEGL